MEPFLLLIRAEMGKWWRGNVKPSVRLVGRLTELKQPQLGAVLKAMGLV